MKKTRLKRLSEEIQKKEKDRERECGLTPAEMLSSCVSHKHSFSLFTRPTHMFLFKAWRAVYPDWRFFLSPFQPDGRRDGERERIRVKKREREGRREGGRPDLAHLLKKNFLFLHSRVTSPTVNSSLPVSFPFLTSLPVSSRKPSLYYGDPASPSPYRALETLKEIYLALLFRNRSSLPFKCASSEGEGSSKWPVVVEHAQTAGV